MNILKIYLGILAVSCLILTGSYAPRNLSSANSKDSILIVFFNNSNEQLQNYLTSKVSEFYNVNIVSDTTLSIPDMAYYKPRNRYHAYKLIRWLSYYNQSKHDKIVGFTNYDISVLRSNNYDHGIFGLGYSPGDAAVVSSYRLKSDSVKCLTILLHEIGHTYGLPHCPSQGCLMNDAKGKMIRIPITGPDLCQKCRSKVFRT